ncbi:unnamed protein product [Rotaria sp. Silwood1]|nr:unnamed protein product [Rotaria sp. Silwood1]CAF4638830.1 unnamed protein product [Rotaria sp. Silwood1]
MINYRVVLIFLSVILFVSTLHGERARIDDLQDEESLNENEDFIEAVKRFWLKKKTSTTEKPSSDVISALVITTPSNAIVTSSRSSIFDGFGSTSQYGRTRYTSSPMKNDCGLNNPCQHGGTCRTLASGRLYCLCTDEYYGNHCEKKFRFSGSDASSRLRKDHCASSPCQNEGECVPLKTTYYCRCKIPYYGINCHKQLSKREQIVDESNSSEQEFNINEYDLERHLKQFIDSEDIIDIIE